MRGYVTEEERTEECPVSGCPKKYDPEKGLRKIALHIAMDGDKEHREWRREHGLPVDYETMKEANMMVKPIKKILKQQRKEERKV